MNIGLGRGGAVIADVSGGVVNIGLGNRVHQARL